MELSFCHRKPRNLSKATIRELSALTLEGVSMMRSSLQDALQGSNDAYIAITARVRGSRGIVGWALVAIRFHHAWVMVFVDDEHRMKGIGRSLLERAKRTVARRSRLSHLESRPWNSRSRDFFKHCGFTVLRGDSNSYIGIR
jgi:GNAT superfamily N-acetyltransferase